MSGELDRIQCQHVEKALGYMDEHGKPTIDKKIYYLERNEGKIDRCTPDGWATKYKGKWIGKKEIIRVAYLYAIGVKPPKFGFSDKDLNKLCNIQISGRAETILKKCGHPCEYR